MRKASCLDSSFYKWSDLDALASLVRVIIKYNLQTWLRSLFSVCEATYMECVDRDKTTVKLRVNGSTGETKKFSTTIVSKILF